MVVFSEFNIEVHPATAVKTHHTYALLTAPARALSCRFSSGQGPPATRPCPHITLPVGAGGGAGYRWKALGEPVTESQKSREEAQTKNFEIDACRRRAQQACTFALAIASQHACQDAATEAKGLVATALAALGLPRASDGRTTKWHHCLALQRHVV